MLTAAALAFELFEWLALFFFLFANSAYILLDILTFFTLPSHMHRRVLAGLPKPHTDFQPPVSLLVPAYNEQSVIVDSVRSLLQLDYPEFEIIVVNDGSTDDTLAVLAAEFDLVAFPEAFRPRLEHRPVEAIYQSRGHPELRVLDKQNGGRKSDALNAAVNAARFPLVCPLDADTVLKRDSIQLLVEPFLEDPRTVAAGGIVRLINGCDVTDGFLTRIELPRHPLALIQIVEYLRAFLFGRIGWAAIDALPVISGAFGLFHKESVIAVGGYRHGVLAEDMDLVLRLHSQFRLEGRPYRVTFVPDPVCWTEAPEDMRTLRNQRTRWHRGLLECMSANRRLFFHPRAGFLGWLTMPFMLIVEGFAPVVEVLGYAVLGFGFAFGLVSPDGFLAFMVVVLGLGLFLTLTAIALELSAYDTYPRFDQVLWLLAAAVIENFGYRQVLAVWRTRAVWDWLRRSEAKWGVMARTGDWQRDPANTTPGAVGTVRDGAPQPSRLAS